MPMRSKASTTGVSMATASVASMSSPRKLRPYTLGEIAPVMDGDECYLHVIVARVGLCPADGAQAEADVPACHGARDGHALGWGHRAQAFDLDALGVRRGVGGLCAHGGCSEAEDGASGLRRHDSTRAGGATGWREV